MYTRTLLLAVCLAGSLSAWIVSSPEKGARPEPLSIEFLPAGNLQVGAPGELLAEPITVRTRPGAEVRFFSPDMGLIEESGRADAVVTADAEGLARARVRLGANLGTYTVIARPAQGDGTDARFTFRAVRAEALRARQAKIQQAPSAKGGAR
jgi:hypothetical protein